MTQKLNLTQSTNEVKANLNLNLYAIDYLKLELKITNQPNELSNKVVIPFIKSIEGEYQQQQESYGQEWIQGSYGNQLKVKAKNSNTLLVEGNLFKWMYGHNITGSTDLIKLVSDTVNKLTMMLDAVIPNEDEINHIKEGHFKIHRIDLNKAILFQDKQAAQMYLEIIKEHGTYPRRKKDIKRNGTYFGLQSKRTTLLYYHKGNELSAHKKQQSSITAELQAYADCMVRCEVRLYSQHLRDNQLNYGYSWNQALVKKIIDEQHSLLNLPQPIAEADLPPRYVRFLATSKQGALPIAYTAKTIARYKRDLAKQYGVMVNG